MTVVNEHTRLLDAPVDDCGYLLDDLGSERDRLWPSDHWPAIRLAPGLTLGAPGGHGPVRYYVEALEPGRRVRFRFTGPEGFIGYHEFRLEAHGTERTRITHVLAISPVRTARLSWPLVFRHLHDALIEDALDRAEASVAGREAPAPPWSPYVRALRAAARPALSRRPRPAGQRVVGGITAAPYVQGSLSLAPDYVDRFELATEVEASPREWATAMFEEGVSRKDRERVWRTLLGLPMTADGQPGTVAGLQVESEDADHIRLAARGSGTSGNLLVEPRPGSVRLTTGLAFTSRRRSVTWRLISRVHRKEAAAVLRSAARLLGQDEGRLGPSLSARATPSAARATPSEQSSVSS